jgi:hypothetical protein
LTDFIFFLRVVNQANVDLEFKAARTGDTPWDLGGRNRVSAKGLDFTRKGLAGAMQAKASQGPRCWIFLRFF